MKTRLIEPDKLNFAIGRMTNKQARRWRLYFGLCKKRVKGKLHRIAEIEGVTYQAIQNTLRSGVKKAEKEVHLMIIKKTLPEWVVF